MAEFIPSLLIRVFMTFAAFAVPAWLESRRFRMSEFMPAFLIRYFITFCTIAVPMIHQTRGASMEQISGWLIALSIGKMAGTVLSQLACVRRIPSATGIRCFSVLQAVSLAAACLSQNSVVLILALLLLGASFSLFRPVAKAVVSSGTTRNTAVFRQCLANVFTSGGMFCAAFLTGVVLCKVGDVPAGSNWPPSTILLAVLLPAAAVFAVRSRLQTADADDAQRVEPQQGRGLMFNPVILVWGLSVTIYSLWHTGVPFMLRQQYEDTAFLSLTLSIQPFAFGAGQLFFARLMARMAFSRRTTWCLLCLSIVCQGIFPWLSIYAAPEAAVFLMVFFGGFLAAFAYPATVHLVFADIGSSERQKRRFFATSGLAADVGEVFGYLLLSTGGRLPAVGHIFIPVLCVVGFMLCWKPAERQVAMAQG